MPNSKNKLGMLLTPSRHVTGALLMNREIFNYLGDKINVKKIVPKREDILKVGYTGEILYYFSALDEARDCNYVMGTSIATVGYFSQNKVIQQFHSVDSVGLEIVLFSYSNSKRRESATINKWHKLITKELTIDTANLQTRLMVYRAAEKFCCQNAKKIIVVSDLVKSQLIKSIGASEDKIKVILNGLPGYWFEDSGQPFVDDAEVVFTTRSNASLYVMLEKGQDRAYEILSRLKAKKIVYTHLSGMALEEKIDHDMLMDTIGANSVLNLSREELKKHYKPGQIFLMTSRTESFNLALAEAMACKMVPVCFPTGLALSHIENGKNGFVVNSVNEAVKIINKLSQDPEERKRLGENASLTAKKYFTYDRMLKEYEEFIRAQINE